MQCLGLVILGLPNCRLEGFKTCRSCTTTLAGQIHFINARAIFACVDLAKYYRMAITGNLLYGLYLVVEWHKHKAIYNIVQETDLVT